MQCLIARQRELCGQRQAAEKAPEVLLKWQKGCVPVALAVIQAIAARPVAVAQLRPKGIPELLKVGNILI